MTTTDGSSDAELELSSQTRNVVAIAIGAYVSMRSTDREGQLRHAAYCVAAEANRVGASSDQMTLAVKRLFERAPRISGDVQKRVEMYNRFVAWCLEAYLVRHDDSR